MELTCNSCHYPISENFYFCPNCGKKIHEPPVSTSVGRQIWIYFLSTFLPPLGLWPGIKYLLQNDEKAKMIGIIAIVLTILSTIITIWISIGLLNQITQQFNTQMNQFQNLGL